MKAITVSRRGRFQAKRADALRRGDVIVRPSGRAHVKSVTTGTKMVWLGLVGLDIDYRTTLWKRRGTLVAIAPRSERTA